MMTTVVIFTIIVLEMSLALDNMGICGHKVQTDPNMDFQKFAAEKSGHWCQVIVPRTSFTLDLQSVSYNISQNNEKEYTHSMSYIRRSGEPGELFTDRVLTDLGNGEAKSTKKGSNTIVSLYFLKYVPDRYAYFFACSSEGSDKDVDYRFVFAHDDLSSEETDEILSIDCRQNFKGELMTIHKC